jgi:hypothetical protein
LIAAKSGAAGTGALRRDASAVAVSILRSPWTLVKMRHAMRATGAKQFDCEGAIVQNF